MIRVAIDLAVMYVFGTLVGGGVFLIAVPPALRTPYLSLLLPQALGLGTLAIVGVYVIISNGTVIEALYISAAFGFAAYILYVFIEIRLRLRPARELLPLATWARSVRRHFWTREAGLSTALMLVVLAPALRANIPTTPFRVGIDQAGYGESAQYLLERGTVVKLRSTLLRRLQTHDLRKAEAQNAKALNIETYVDSEFLLKALRLGFPAVIASLVVLTHSQHAFEIEFMLLSFNYALVIALTYYLFTNYFRLSSRLAMALAFALGLNCNMLNVLYEGQLAQIFVLPYFTLILILYVGVRTRPARMDRASLRCLLRPAALFAFLLATLFCAYNESIVLLFGVMFVVLALDVALYGRTSFIPLCFLTVGIMLAGIIALPISMQWIKYSFANLANLGIAGFWQPHWASFAEILGLLNMYGDLNAVLLNRSFYNSALNVVLSSIFVIAMALFVLRRDLDRSFWLAPGLTIAAAYEQMHTLHPILNYPYMKVYTMLLPLTFCSAFAALVAFAGAWGSSLRFVYYAAIVCVAASGLLYLGQYSRDGSFVSRDMFALYQNGGLRRLSRYALIVPSNASPVETLRSKMLLPILSMNWLNEDLAPRVIAPYLTDRIVLLLSNEALLCRSCFVHQFARGILYKNDSFVIYDTGITVAEDCVPEATRYSLSLLGYSSGDKWEKLPRHQCDYDRFYLLQRPWAS